MNLLISLVSHIIQLLNISIFIWCLLSWFSGINWQEQPFRTLDKIVSAFLAPFRNLIPPIGNIDITPMIAILLLQMISSFLGRLN